MKRFTYGIGASWIFAFPARPVDEYGKRVMTYRKVRYTVTGCRLHGRAEFYAVRLEERGKAAHEIEQSASRLRYLINFNLSEVLADGERAEYPLTAEEVAIYYERERTERMNDNRRARYMLDHHKGYQDLKAKKSRAEMLAGKAEAENDFERAAALGGQIVQLDAALAEIREGLGITDAVLDLKYDCPKCRDRGVLENGEICDCVRGHEGEIRAYFEREFGEAGA